MITEDYVSFEVAKLLKEKGFDEQCTYMYNSQHELYSTFEQCRQVTRNNSDWIHYIGPLNVVPIAVPTLQMAMKWLREVHNIFIDICTLSPLVYTYRVCLISDTTGYFYEDYACEEGERFMSYKEAVEFALDYCLTNLI